MTAYSHRVLTDRAQAYWPLDEATSADGSTVADIANGYNGSNLIVPGAGGVGAFSASVHSWQCDGNRAIDVPTGGSLAHGGSPFSYEAWIKPDADAYGGGKPAGGDILSVMGTHFLEQTRFSWVWDDTAGHGYVSVVNRVAGHSVGVGFAPTGDLRGSWHHVVATWDGTAVALYADAVSLPIDSSITSDQIAALGNTFGGVQARVGADWAGTSNWSGDLDDVAVYPTALTPCRVRSHYDLATTGTYSECPHDRIRLVRAAGLDVVRMLHRGGLTLRLVNHD